MQTDLSYGVQQEQHDTHASWLPRACLFRIFTQGQLWVPGHPHSISLHRRIEDAFEHVMWMCYIILSRLSSLVCHPLAMSSLEILRGFIQDTYLTYFMRFIYPSLFRAFYNARICVTRVHIIKCRNISHSNRW